MNSEVLNNEDLKDDVDKNKANKNKPENGSYIETYPGGRPALKENYVNGKLHGLREVWYNPRCLPVSHRETDQLEIKETYANGFRQGLREAWWSNGQLKVKENYVNGLLNGLQKRWCVNGQISTKENRLNGKYHGPEKWWYDCSLDPGCSHQNGHYGGQTNHAYGLYHGYEKQWDSEGHLILREDWIDDKRHGLRDEWDYSSNVSQHTLKENYIYGSKIGDEEYHIYRDTLTSVLNQIIQISDLMKLTSSFLQSY